MCWLPIDQPLLAPGDSTGIGRRPSPCSVAQLLASRLRRIGDQLERSWAAGDAHGGSCCCCCCCGDRCTTAGPEVAVEVVAGPRGHLRGFLFTVIRLTVRVLFVAGQHL